MSECNPNQRKQLVVLVWRGAVSSWGLVVAVKLPDNQWRLQAVQHIPL